MMKTVKFLMCIGLLSFVRCFQLPSIKAFSHKALSLGTTEYEIGSSLTRLDWKENGYKSYMWNNHKINYVDLGKSSDPNHNKPPLVLIHGFGASVYHWRYNIPALSENYHVFAVDLLGFGLSDKPIIDYDATIWRDQILHFIKDIVFKETSSIQPCVVAGNSLGGFAALAASASNSMTKDLIKGCILLNAAGRFRDDSAITKKPNPEWLESLLATFQRFIISLSFYYTKQPLRVEQILKQVYIDTRNVDKDLIESIIHPARNPNAPEVFYRVIAKNGNGPALYIDDLLKALKLPLLLLWGDKDPWIRPAAADRIQSLYPTAQRVNVDAGHCPHDENPEAVNLAITNFMQSLN